MKSDRRRPVIGVSQRVDVIESYGERRDALDQAWTSLLEDANLKIAPLPNESSQALGLAKELKLDGVILSGGNDLSGLGTSTSVASERDDMEGSLIDWCSQTRTPLLAVCRGLQMLVRHVGGSLMPITGHIARNHSIRWCTEEVAAGQLLSISSVNSFHGFALKELGPHLRPLAYAGDNVEAVVGNSSSPQVGIMWHPERNAPKPDDRLLYLNWIRNYFR